VEIEAPDPRCVDDVRAQHEERVDIEEEMDVEIVDRIGEGSASELRCRPDIEPYLAAAAATSGRRVPRDSS
jgi:hypothetical protein